MAPSNWLQTAQREYAESQVLSAQPVVIVQMLYEVAIRALESARVHLEKREYMERAREISRAQEAVTELILALDRSVSSTLTPGLSSLYAYVQEQILLGHVRQSDKSLREAISILTVLLEGWTGVRKQTQGQTALEESVLVPAHAESEAPHKEATGRASAYQEEAESPSRDWSC